MQRWSRLRYDEGPEPELRGPGSGFAEGGLGGGPATGSHIRLQKNLPDETLKLTVPAHRPIKRSTLSHILKHARLSVEDLLKLS